MREMDAFEQAYKNGYAAGMKAAEEKIVRCKDCKYEKRCDGGVILGNRHEDGEYFEEYREVIFCSYGERRSDG